MHPSGDVFQPRFCPGTGTSGRHSIKVLASQVATLSPWRLQAEERREKRSWMKRGRCPRSGVTSGATASSLQQTVQSACPPACPDNEPLLVMKTEHFKLVPDPPVASLSIFHPAFPSTHIARARSPADRDLAPPPRQIKKRSPARLPLPLPQGDLSQVQTGGEKIETGPKQGLGD